MADESPQATCRRVFAALAVAFLVGASPSASANDAELDSTDSEPLPPALGAAQPATAAPAGDEARPTQDPGHAIPAAPPRWGVGVSAGGGALLVMPSLALSLSARARVLDWLTIEPHIDGAAGSLILLVGGLVQVGVPGVVEVPVDPVRLRVGAGPTVSYGKLVSEFSGPRDTFIMLGGEGLVGVALPLNEYLELNGHLAGRLGAPINGSKVLYLSQAFATLGVMLTL